MFPKNLIVCCDGTWNDPADKTNIAWLKNHILDDGKRQIVYYDEGVGTESLTVLTGGLFGAGLSKNILQAYAFLQAHFRPGDSIYCFGFSRGAFTTRSLCGFTDLVGQLPPTIALTEAFKIYRQYPAGSEVLNYQSLHQQGQQHPMPVYFLGVFDTVGALGLPRPQRRSESTKTTAQGAHFGYRLPEFHNTRLSPMIEHAYHALAIDEYRVPFRPTLWTRSPGMALKLSAKGELYSVPQKVEQSWFPGSHADIGGGYTHSPRLADLPLLWMVEKASYAGLLFKPGAIRALRSTADILAPQHDSLTLFWRCLNHILERNAGPRLIAPETGAAMTIHPAARQRLHQPVRLIAGNTVTFPCRYQPANLVAALKRLS